MLDKGPARSLARARRGRFTAVASHVGRFTHSRVASQEGTLHSSSQSRSQEGTLHSIASRIARRGRFSRVATRVARRQRKLRL